MGIAKTIERSGKRALMRFVGWCLRAPRVGPDELRARSFERILVIRQHNQMGDMLLAVPALRAIKETYPRSRLDILSSTLNKGVMQICPYVGRVFTYDKRRLFGHVALVRSLRRQRYDLAIVLHTVSFSFTSLALAILAGARLRIGSTSRRLGDSLTGSYLNLTLPLPTGDELATMNEAEHNLYPLRAVGITTADLAPRIVPGESSERWADEFSRECWKRGVARLAVHPGAGKRDNIWPPERFAAVVNRIARDHATGIAVVEGPSDTAAVSAFLGSCEVPATVVRRRAIGDVAALLQRADLVLCNDTGVMHVSAAAGANTLAVFGPTDPSRWAPRCDRLSVIRPADGSLSGLPPAPVAERAMELLVRWSGLGEPSRGLRS